MKRKNQAWKPLLALACTLLGGGAWAANVDLTSNISPRLPSDGVKTMRPLLLDVEFGNNSSSATSPVATIELPAGLTAVSLAVGVGGNGAHCPAPSAFGAIASPLTDGSQHLTAIIGNLPNGSGQSCKYVLSVTPVQPVTYDFVSNIHVGGVDAETNAGSNRSNNPLTISKGQVNLSVEKTVLTVGGTAVTVGSQHPTNGKNIYAGAYNQLIRFQVVYKNDSPDDLPLGAIATANAGRAGFEDWEGTRYSNIYPASSTFQRVSCSSSVDNTASAICAALQYPSEPPARGTDLSIFDSQFTDEVLKAGEAITIVYERTYAPPYCGTAGIYNSAIWHVPDTLANVTWGGTSKSNTSEIEMDFTLSNPEKTCQEVELYWQTSKTLLGVQKAGQSQPDASVKRIDSDGDLAIYEITIDLTDPRNQALASNPDVPQAVRLPEIDVYDTIETHLGMNPSALPMGSFLQEARWMGCEIDSTATNWSTTSSNCGSPLSYVFLDYSENVRKANGRSVYVALGQKMVLRVGLSYKMNPAPVCKRIADSIRNDVQLRVMPLPDSASPYIYSTGRALHSADLLEILPNLPHCINLGVTNSVSPAGGVPDASSPVTFTLTFRNTTDGGGPVRVTQAVGRAALPSGFSASSVTCQANTNAANAPTAVVPSGNLSASHMGAGNVFSLPIGDMSSGSEVVCQVTGTFSQAGSFNVSASIDLAPGAQAVLADNITLAAAIDADMVDNQATQNVMARGIQVTLTKTVSTQGPVKPGDTLVYTVTAANYFGNDADGTVIQDALPVGIESFTWSCTSTNGAICPRASGNDALNEVVAKFPSGGELIYEFRAVVGAQAQGNLINTARAVLPNGFASCGPNSTPGPCTATVTTTVTPSGGTPGVVQPVPVMGAWAWLALLLGVASVGAIRQRKGIAALH